MENPFENVESQEEFTPLEVSVRDKRGDKNFMLVFNSNDPKMCEIYNEAIFMVLQKHEMRPFHQIGFTNREPGVHGWEVWVPTEKSEMEKMIAEVQEEAKRIFDEYNQPLI